MNPSSPSLIFYFYSSTCFLFLLPNEDGCEGTRLLLHNPACVLILRVVKCKTVLDVLRATVGLLSRTNSSQNGNNSKERHL